MMAEQIASAIFEHPPCLLDCLKLNRTASDYVESGQQLMSAQDAQAPVSVSTSQTKATSADGLHTVATEKISSSAYAEYVDSFSSKASSSSGPTQRSTSAYSGA